ncbi:MAG: hypothetical protein ACM3L8_03480 [Verrucomicrobiota bacterium]
MIRNILLLRNGCEGCSMEACLGVVLAEFLHADVTALYVTENFTWRELRDIYNPDELKWPAAGRVGRGAMEAARMLREDRAREVLETAEKMCAARAVPCKTVHLSCRSPRQGALKVATENRCDLILASDHPGSVTDLFFESMEARAFRQPGIPLLFHHATHRTGTGQAQSECGA